MSRKTEVTVEVVGIKYGMNGNTVALIYRRIDGRESGNRTAAGPTVPPGGLYMTHLWYDDGVQKFECPD